MEDMDEVEEREEDMAGGESIPCPNVSDLGVFCSDESGWMGMARDARANESVSRREPNEVALVRSKAEMEERGGPSRRGRGFIAEAGDPNEREGSKRSPMAPPSAGVGVEPNPCGE